MPLSPEFLIQLGTAVDRTFVAGILRYTLSRPDWTVMPAAFDEHQLKSFLRRPLSAHALILGLIDPATTAAARRARIPIVNVIDSHFTSSIPTVTIDNHACGRLAFEHLHDRGIRHFAYLPWAPGADNLLRQQGFLAAARDYNLLHQTTVLPNVLGKSQWIHDIHKQADVFKQLLQPSTGILLFSDWLASPAMIALRQAGFSIRNDIAILGIGDDELLCPALRPPLTSIDFNGLRVGHHAAELLHHLLSSPPTSKCPPTLRIPPLGVIERASTQLMACDDPDVAAAVLYIEQQLRLGHRPTTSQVARHILVPRRTLDAKFDRHLQQSPAQLAAKYQLRLALRLLERSDAKLHDIATRTGFKSPTLLSRAVRHHTGKSPSQYRQWARLTP